LGYIQKGPQMLNIHNASGSIGMIG
jgi:hypothetical protein